LNRKSHCFLAGGFLINTREIQAIKRDVDNWKNISHWKGFWSRDQIKAALAKHEKNLTDCFNSFLVNSFIPQQDKLYLPSSIQIGTTFQLGVMIDNRAAGTSSIERSDHTDLIASGEQRMPCLTWLIDFDTKMLTISVRGLLYQTPGTTVVVSDIAA